MKKVILTVLIMLQLFYIGLVNAKVDSFNNGYGEIVAYIEIYGFRFNYIIESEVI